MGEDIYPLGEVELKEKNIVETRKETARRLKEKSRVRECILNDIQRSSEYAPVEPLVHLDYVPPWQRALRSRPNNLGLK